MIAVAVMNDPSKDIGEDIKKKASDINLVNKDEAIKSFSDSNHTPPLKRDQSIESIVDFNDILIADDLYSQALQLLNKAEKGDSKAQFLLYTILERCSVLKFFPNETALASFMSNGNYGKGRQVIASEFNKCAGFVDSKEQFRDKDYWLGKSYEQGYPQAKIEVGSSYLAMYNWPEEMIPDGMELSDELFSQMKHDILSYVSLDEPNTLIQLAFSPIESELYDADDLMLALFKVACDNGYDCSEQSAFYDSICTLKVNCSIRGDINQYIRDSVVDAQRVDRVNNLAINLEEAIKAGDWKRVGF